MARAPRLVATAYAPAPCSLQLCTDRRACCRGGAPLAPAAGAAALSRAAALARLRGRRATAGAQPRLATGAPAALATGAKEENRQHFSSLACSETLDPIFSENVEKMLI
jgi:hypothetical protein